MPIFQDYHRTVIGYHGTRRRTALDIVAGKKSFEPSENDDDWLGHGIYFWEYAPKQALTWAKKRYPGEKIAVLGSMIRLGNCLDLLDPDNAKELVEIQKDLENKSKSAGKKPIRNCKSKKYLDCKVLQYAYEVYNKQSDDIESARAVYVPTQSKDRLWKASWLYHETHIQLCVRNKDLILGTWLVDTPEENR